ncbi:hypothetical protein [Kitasatospora sp. NPDC093102]|uniref:hypothetical protein n=1 Tax=Kitasatospora sp. NPDC093102 TaxID=3155069 RepID=UPI00343ED4AD
MTTAPSPGSRAPARHGRVSGTLADLHTELHRLDIEHARHKGGLIQARLNALDPLGPAVARYAAAALAALAATVEDTDPVTAIRTATEAPDPDPTVRGTRPPSVTLRWTPKPLAAQAGHRPTLPQPNAAPG